MLTLVRHALRTPPRAVVRLYSNVAPQAKVASAKPVLSAADAVKDIGPGATLLIGGFDLCGTPRTLIHALLERSDATHLKIISNNTGTPGHGIGMLTEQNRVAEMFSSYVGGNREFIQQYLAGKVTMNLIPQGSIAEKLRAGAYGIPAFYTPTGWGTDLEKGLLVSRYEERTPEQIAADAPLVPKTFSRPREVRHFNGRPYLLEEAFHGDYALIYADKVDMAGNVKFHGTARNFNDAMGRNATVTIVEAKEVVPVGELDVDEIHMPGVFVDRIVQSTMEMELEKLVYAKDHSGSTGTRKDIVAARAAKELEDGMYVNLGIGLPGLVPSFLPEGVNVTLQCENGLLGMGPYPDTPDQVDPSMVNAGKEAILTVPGAASFDSADSFGIIRGGHLHVTMLGALQVTNAGDLANFFIPGKLVTGMGGAMDLLGDPDKTRVVVLTEHVDKHGRSKIVKETKLPLTGRRCVSRVITDLAVFDIDRQSGTMKLVELQPGVTEEQVREATDAPYDVALKA